MLRAPNAADPHGYYAEIGVRPDASEDEIRSAVRRWYFELHPDTGTQPDADALQRINGISEVLLDPMARERYNRTPPGARMMDRVYRDELIGNDILNMLTEEEVSQAMRPQRPVSATTFDYLAVDHQEDDSERADRWYRQLVSVAPFVGYRRVIKVLLHDGPEPDWNPMASIVMIPRFWPPSSATALAIFVVTMGFSLSVS